MNATLTIWGIQLKSLRNAARHDQRMQFALVIGLTFTIIIGLWAAIQLSQRLHGWQMQGPSAVDAGLWSLCLLTWGGMSTFTVLANTLRTLSDDESLVLFSLPITPAIRFRTLYGSFFIGNLWNWLLLELGVTGCVLVSVLGWHALVWLVLLQLGVGISVLATLIVVLLVIRYLIPKESFKTRVVVATMLGVTVILIAISLFISKPHIPAYTPRPELVSALFVLLLITILGPCAAIFGRLYEAAFQTTQSWNRSPKVRTLPGIGLLTSVLTRSRTLTAALFVKMLLSQSRNIIAWLRIGIVLIILAFYSQLHTFAAHQGWSDTVFVIGLAAGLAILSVVEQAPNAISGEANRLTMYLAAPIKLAVFLRTKLILFMLPVVIEAMIFGIFLSWRFGLSLVQTGFALIAIILIVTGSLTIFICGSAWDEDLNQAVEGAMQTMLQEEVPITPRRMWLFNLGIASFVGMFLLVWKLPTMLALVLLFLLIAGIVMSMWQFGLARLHKLVRDG